MGTNPIDVLWVLICSVLVLFMQAGFTCLETGFTRHKNSINVAIKNMADFGLAAALFWMVGFAIMFGKSVDGIFGATGYFFHPMDVSEITFFLFQVMFTAAAVTIVSGAIAERIRFPAYLIIAAMVSALIYPMIGHWAWGGIDLGTTTGWLNKLGFIDFAGSTVVHSTGGWVALAVVLIIGPREGRFLPGRPPTVIPGSSIPVAVLGALILWVGWLGFNGGSTLVFNETVPLVLLNTMLAPVAGMMTALIIDWYRYKYARVDGVINGTLGGLVAVTANSNIVTPLDAVVIGIIAGLVVLVGLHLLEKFKIDDVVGAIPVHAFAGVWGTLAVAFFGDPSAFGGRTPLEQLYVQLLGVTVAFVWAFGFSYVILRLINKISPLRISKAGELKGLNISEHHASSEIVDLFYAMEQQALTGDLSARVHEEPYTEAGQIAHRFNKVLDKVTVETDIANRMAKIAELSRQEAEVIQDKLHIKLGEIGEFNKMAVGRELRMVELKKEINDLCIKAGTAPRYDVDFKREKKEIIDRAKKQPSESKENEERKSE